MKRDISVLAAAFGCLCAVAGAASATDPTPDPAPGGRPIGVVELFTSQGCANCPPADAFLGELARGGDLVALSYPVDYWDYMGWKDTAARPEFTRRQKGYAHHRGDRDVYTPQMVVNGRKRLVGSDREGIRREIAAGDADRHDLSITVGIDCGSEALKVRLPDAAAESDVNATVWLVRFDLTRTVTIGRGENNGRTLTYTTLVRSLQPIGMWKGRAATIELPRPETQGDPNFGCAVLVQSDKDDLPGPILGAALCSPPRG